MSSDAIAGLIAIEKLSAAFRKGTISPQAIEALFMAPRIWNEWVIPAILNGSVSMYDLQELAGERRGEGYGEPGNHAMARMSLGHSFIDLTRFTYALRGFVEFTDEEVEQLSQIPFTRDELLEELEHGAVLFPSHPSVTLELLHEIFRADPDVYQPCFQAKTKGKPPWWMKRHEKSVELLRTRSLPLGWYLVRTQPVEDSGWAKWVEMEEMIPQTHRRTWALEVALASFLFQRTQRGGRLFEDCSAWCVDADESGRVAVGKFGNLGFKVDGFFDPTHSRESYHLFLSRKPSGGQLESEEVPPCPECGFNAHRHGSCFRCWNCGWIFGCK